MEGINWMQKEGAYLQAATGNSNGAIVENSRIRSGDFLINVHTFVRLQKTNIKQCVF
jgi:hypothetical protein